MNSPCGTKRAKPPLRFRPRSPSPFRRLPFVGSRERDGLGDCWAVPATGGFSGGCATGRALATLFLKHLRAHPRDEFYAPYLAWIATGLAVRFEEEGGCAMLGRPVYEYSAGFESVLGQSAGFFGTLASWLAVAARTVGQPLDRLDEAELLAAANAGLRGP